MFDKQQISKIWNCMNASGEINKEEKDEKIKSAMYNMKRRLKNPNNPTIISLMKTIIYMNDKHSSMESDYWWKNMKLEDENKELKDKYEYMERRLRELENKIETKEQQYNDLWRKHNNRPKIHNLPKHDDIYETPLDLHLCQDDSQE